MTTGMAGNPVLLLWIAGFGVLGSIGAVAGASLFLLFPAGIRGHLIPGLNCQVRLATSALQTTLILAGIGTIMLLQPGS